MPKNRIEDNRKPITLLEFIVYPSDLFKEYVFTKSDKYQCEDKFSKIDIIDPHPEYDSKSTWINSLKQLCNYTLCEKLNTYRDNQFNNDFGHPFNYAFCCHDQDFEYDELDQVDNDTRTRVTKVHYHVCIMFLDALNPWEEENIEIPFLRLFGSLAVEPYEYQWRDWTFTFYRPTVRRSKRFGNLLHVQKAVHANSKLRYLIHRGFPNKYQYPFEDIISDIDISKHPAFEEERTYHIVQAITDAISSGQFKNWTQLQQWCLKCRFLKEFRQNFNMFRTQFNNEMYIRNHPAPKDYDNFYELPDLKDLQLPEIYDYGSIPKIDTSLYFLSNEYIFSDVPLEYNDKEI